ncbi:hypothetical protein D9M71_489760 [compost metagenome]
MLDVDRGVDVDAGVEQLLHVLPALGVAAAGGVGVGQFVDQHQRRRGLEQAVEVHFLEGDAAVLAAQHGLLLKATKQYLGFSAAVGFDHPGQHLHTLALLGVGGLEHGEGLADAGGGAEEHLQPAPASSREGSQQRVCAGGITHVSSFSVAASCSLFGPASQAIAGKPAPTGTAQPAKAAQYLWELACRRWAAKRPQYQWLRCSSAWFKTSTLTTGGPINGWRVASSSKPCKRSTGSCRAAATLGIW